MNGTGIALAWTASPSTGVVKYEVLRDGTVIGEVANGFTYTDTGLTAGKTYSYQARAVDGSGQNLN